MAKNKKPLLNEGTVRRMMKLANMEALGNGFISEKYTPLEEEEVDEGTKKGQPKMTTQSARGAKKGDEAFVNEQEDELDVEAEEEVEDVDMEAELDVEEPPAEMEGEITITDEEAQDIIDLAAKLEDAVGGGDAASEEEVGMEMDMEMGPEGEEMDMGAEEEELPMQEGLYEAALQGLNIDLVDDKAQRRKAVVQEVKKRIYERVVNRLIKESQAPQKRRPQQRRRKK